MTSRLLWLVVILVASCLVILIVRPAYSRDEGQWKYAAPDVQEYFQKLMQPDAFNVSCCGDSDAYYTDRSETDGAGNLYAIITDTRPDEWTRSDGSTGRRPHREVGSKVLVPPSKIRKHPIPNPTDHGLIFLALAGTVYCYEPMPLI
jgi:hypothetical protein